VRSLLALVKKGEVQGGLPASRGGNAQPLSGVAARRARVKELLSELVDILVQ
jgi:hypothetical protein